MIIFFTIKLHYIYPRRPSYTISNRCHPWCLSVLYPVNLCTITINPIVGDWLCFTLLLTQTTLGRQLFTPNLHSIAISLHLTNQDALATGSLAESVAAGSSMIGAIVWGILADRFSPHTSLSVAAPFASIAIFLCGLTHWHNSVELYLVSRALNGFCSGGAIPLAMARVAELTSEFYRPRGVLHIMLVNAISSGLGQTIATMLSAGNSSYHLGNLQSCRQNCSCYFSGKWLAVLG